MFSFIIIYLKVKTIELIIDKMKLVISVFITLLFTNTVSYDCGSTSTFIPTTALDSTFDTTFSSLRSPDQLNTLINNPTDQNLKEYIYSLAPAAVPLWSFALLTLILFVACVSQLCCYHCCRVEACGTQIDQGSYTPANVKCCAFSFFVFSLVIIVVTVGGFVVASDLSDSLSKTNCNSQNLFDLSYNGNSNLEGQPWAGFNVFNTLIANLSAGYFNTIPTLANSYQTTNPDFQELVDTTTGSLYNNSQIYNCPTALTTSTVRCPFSNSATCADGAANLPVFSAEYCNASFSGSTQNLIVEEMTLNSTAWQQNLLNLESSLASANSSLSTNLSSFFSEITSYVSTIKTYQDDIRTSIDDVKISIKQNDNYIYYAEIAAYSLMALILFCALLGFVAVMMAYCCRRYKARSVLNFLWVMYFILGLLLFVLAGFLILSSAATYDACSAYGYYTTTPGALSGISDFSTSDSLQIINSCFFVNTSGNIFQSFNTTDTTFQSMTEINGFYESVVPDQSFSSVTDNITQRLQFISSNPNEVELENQNSTTNSPQVALDQANLFANGSISSTCNATNDYLVFNQGNCTPFFRDQTAPSQSCVIVTSTSSTLVAGREASFDSNGCSANFTIYENNFNALLNYGTDVQQLSFNYQSQSNFPSYRQNYFDYYNGVEEFVHSSNKALFESFLTPFSTLVDESSCPFLTANTNSLVNVACNQNFGYLTALGVIVAIQASFIMLLMITSFFLVTRLEYYDVIEGDFSNYREKDKEDLTVANGINMIELQSRQSTNRTTTNRQQLLNTPYPTELYKHNQSY